ncbi:Glycosyl transferase, family 2 [Syntrophobacter sp. SbD1]|nr:Glycosyl transferase, family 2 [Syntrophobacter sp. SbD1]
MNTDPITNDPNDPLVSILVYNYDGQYLRQCLGSIFHQDILKNFEIVLIDDATNDGSWDTVLEYLRQYPRRITVQRNRRVLGPATNFHICLGIAKGRYCTDLMNDQAFLPEYINRCIKTMIPDPYAKFQPVFRTEDPGVLVPLQSTVPLPGILGGPLVSILCYNYNYGRYLRQSLESVFAQTYENIELCFSDNASTDESWGIALEFARKYPGKMSLTRNRRNFGPDANFANCRRNMQGEYFVNFCSDDALEPEYVERCVSALEAHPDAGFAIVNRAIIDEHGRRTEEPPFYNQSCIIPGEEQAAVYMMAGINPSVSQIMYRNCIANSRAASGTLVSRYYGTRILDFNISVDFDVAFIKEPLLLHRLHSQSDTNQADANLLPIMGLYVLNHQFADIASVRNLTKAASRLPQSLDKLAHLAVRYSVRSLLSKDEHTALRYFHLAMAINPQLAGDPKWKQLQEYWTADAPSKSSIIEQLGSSDNLAARSISYDPPDGSTAINPDGKACSLATS